MRGARRLTLGLLLALTSQAPALAVEPDDTPWDLRGTDSAGKPQTIDDLLARDQMSIIEDTDISPPGQDQRDGAESRDGQRFEEDHLSPKLPAEVHDAPARAPDTALSPIPNAPMQPTVALRHAEPVQATEPAMRAIEPLEPSAQPTTSPNFKPEPVAPVATPRRAVAPLAKPPVPVAPAQASPTQAAPSQAAQSPAGARPADAATGRLQPSQAALPTAPSGSQPAPAPSPAVAAPSAANIPAQNTPPQSAPAQSAPAQSAPAAQSAPTQNAATAPAQTAPNVPAQGAPSAALQNTGIPAQQVQSRGAPPATPVQGERPQNVPVKNAGLPATAPLATTPPPLSTAPPAQSTVAKDGNDAPAPPPMAIPSEPVNQAAVAVNGKLYLPLKRYFETRAAVTLADYDGADRTALLEYYEATLGEALWVGKDGFNDAAQSLIAEIKKADDWGLSSNDYKIPSLILKSGGAFDYEDLADAEIKLSLTAMMYARHARGDRIDNPREQLASYIDRKPQLIERPKLLAALAAASDKSAYLRSLHPKHPQFERLRDLLIQQHGQQVSGSEPEPIPGGPKIMPGKSHWQIALLRTRLNVTAAPVKSDGTPADTEFFDAALADAVIQYKEKNQISPANAAITNDLRHSLNQSNRVSEEVILANMEEWRWMPEDLGETYVWVNIPEFLVRVKKSDRIIHEERIIAGRMETQTPIFSDKMRTVVFQPPWNVPESIKVNELLPKLRAGDNPIASQGLRLERNGHEVDVWDVDWNSQDIRNYHIFQPPGDANVLGIVKFLFPNKHSVYLHDTPTKRLFNEKVRTFSHGCMRVRDPVRLAEVIMAEDKGWTPEQVNELITTGPEDNDVALDKPMPVHVVYFTLWIDDDGQAKTFADVYGHEKRIKLALNGRWSDIEKPRDHLLPPEDPGRVAGTPDDWGDQDEDVVPKKRRTRQAARYDDDPPPRQYSRVPPPGYKQVSPKKSGSGISDLFKNIFGNN